MLWQATLEGATLMPWGTGTLSLEAEGTGSFYADDAAKSSILGGLVAATVKEDGFDYGLRVSALRGSNIAVLGTDIIFEITPTFVTYLNGDNAKLVIDAPMIINSLVDSGKQYDMYTQPGNIGSSPVRQTVMYVRALAQFEF